MDEKTEAPTDKKIEDAREKGQVGVSRDLAKVLGVAAMAELAFGSEPYWRSAINSLMNDAFTHIGKPFIPAAIEMLQSLGILLLLVFTTCFVLCAVVAVIAFWGQFGILLESKIITPDLDKINPVNGIKQLFSKKKLGETAMTLVKFLAIGLIMYLVIRGELPNIISLAGGVPKDSYYGFITILHNSFYVVMALCLLLALIDFVMQKYFHTKSLMMSMEDIKREYKESEGDPMVKGQRKQIARELAESGPVADTNNANAVVVNPTHFAVAMLYDTEKAAVPIVLAKGKDEIAQLMIKRAHERGIPVIRHVWLARTLYATARIKRVIPKSSYDAVAFVYAVIQDMQESGRADSYIELEKYGDPPPD